MADPQVVIHYLDGGEPEKALRCFASAIRIGPPRGDPRFVDALYNAGVALGRLGRRPEAIAAYREAIRLDRGNADAWVNLSIAYGEERRYGDSVECLRAALGIRPRDPVALRALALAHLESGDRGAALAAHARLREVDAEAAAEVGRELGLR